MKPNIFLRFLLIVALLLVNITPAFASSGADGNIQYSADIREFIDTMTEEDYAKNPLLPNLVKELEELIKDNEKVSTEEVNKIIDKYALPHSKESQEASVKNLKVESSTDDFKRIDSLAKKYYKENYNYYLENGKFSDESSVNLPSLSITSVNSDAIAILKVWVSNGQKGN